jgi:hypothetical protein
MYNMDDVLVEGLSMSLLHAVKVLYLLGRRGCYRCFNEELYVLQALYKANYL